MKKTDNGFVAASAMLPFEKYAAFGAEKLTDEELLAIIIRKGTRDRDALMIARELLRLYGNRDGILNLMKFSDRDFRSIRGIGPVKAIQLGAISELSKRIWKERCRSGAVLSDPKSIADYFKEELRYLHQERVILLLLDSQHRELRSVAVSQGTVSSAAISPREIFYEAIQHRAACFVVIHNHPSGCARPSETDIEFAAGLKLAGMFMNIPLLDCLIIADNDYVSFNEKGYFRSSKTFGKMFFR